MRIYFFDPKTKNYRKFYIKIGSWIWVNWPVEIIWWSTLLKLKCWRKQKKTGNIVFKCVVKS